MENQNVEDEKILEQIVEELMQLGEKKFFHVILLINAVTDKVAAKNADIKELTAKLASAEKLLEYYQSGEGDYIDEQGNTWQRPTAEAYYHVCKARDKRQERAEQAEKERDEALGKLSFREDQLKTKEEIYNELTEQYATIRQALTNVMSHLVYFAKESDTGALYQICRKALDSTPAEQANKVKKLVWALEGIRKEIDYIMYRDKEKTQNVIFNMAGKALAEWRETKWAEKS